jgi:hypothetical protein
MTGTTVMTKAQLDTLRRTEDEINGTTTKVELTPDHGSPLGTRSNYVVRVRHFILGYGYVSYRIAPDGTRLASHANPIVAERDEAELTRATS